MNAEQLAHFRKKLLDQRRTVQKRIAGRDSDIMDTVREEDGVGDTADSAQRMYDREDAIVSNEIDAQELAQIQKALARLEAGTYGLSEVSGKPIPLARLEAVPSATTLSNEEPF